jgi:hypothetical protein
MDGVDWNRILGQALGACFIVLIIYLGMWLWGIVKKTGGK